MAFCNFSLPLFGLGEGRKTAPCCRVHGGIGNGLNFCLFFVEDVLNTQYLEIAVARKMR